MLYLILILSLVLSFTQPQFVSAQDESTPTATGVKAKQIEDLKERLATKVAQLQQLQTKAIDGTVKSVSLTSATIETSAKDYKIELSDEIKIFQYLKGKRTQLSLEDLAKGDRVVVFGNYDSTLDLLKAKVILIYTSQPVRVSGKITQINKEDYVINLTTADETKYTIDIETTSKTFVWNGQEIVKGGFSKLSVGDEIQVLGNPVSKKENQLSATRILNLGDLSGTPKPTSTPTNTPTPKPTP